MISLAGGDPITTGSPDKYDIAAERLLTADPQVILLGDAAYGVKPDDVAKRPGWSTMTAVKDGAIRPIDDTTITRPGPRLFSGLQLPGSGHPSGRDDPVGKPHPAGPVTSPAADGRRHRGQAPGRVACTRPAGAAGRQRPGRAGRRRGARDRARHRGRSPSATPWRSSRTGCSARTCRAPIRRSAAIVWDLRLPRVLTAMVVGAGLAVAGATFQGLLRNPLADPYVLGTASGAALGAAIAVLIPVRALFLGFGLVQAFAFVGALLAITVVYRLSRVSGLAPLTSLLLTGYAVASLLSAGLAMAMYLSGRGAPPDLQLPARQLRRWRPGSGSSWALPIVVVGSLLILSPGEVAQRPAAGRGGREQPRASTWAGSGRCCSVSPRSSPRPPSPSAGSSASWGWSCPTSSASSRGRTRGPSSRSR